MGNEIKQEITENDRKKEYLWKYQKSVRRIHRIDSEISELRELKEGVSGMSNDGMPHGNTSADLSSYVAELDEEIWALREERCRRIKLYKDISRRIKSLKSTNENDVLFYRYIKGLDWWEIAEKMNYSERHIFRFHGKALAHFILPTEDVSECQ